jgi:hypothetical protein
METLILNLFGGPGTGKSTTCAGVFHELKLRGVNAEMSLEFAKDLVWRDNLKPLNDQIYMFGTQHERIWSVKGEVDIIVTDAPLLLSLIYGKDQSDTFKRLVVEEHAKLHSLNVFLQRIKPYNPNGRLQTEEESAAIDGKLVDILDFLGEPHFTFKADETAAKRIADFALKSYQDIQTPFGVYDLS